MMPNAAAAAERTNRLLASLPPAECERVTGTLQRVTLAAGRVLSRPDKPVTHVVFPVSAVVSLVVVMLDRSTVEVASVGNEGVIGTPALLGTGSLPLQAVVQVPGVALRAEAPAVAAQVRDGGALLDLVQRYAQALFTQVARTGACNGMHSVVQRCARWLLMAHDGAGQDEFPLTQEALSHTLGVRRASVSRAAGSLQYGGSIRYRYGRVRVLDRAKLGEVACECYRAIHGEYDRLLDAPALG